MTTEQSFDDESLQEEGSQPVDVGLATIFDYKELQLATNFFNPSEVVGEGGYGIVYRGKLADGRDVAVKELSFRHKKRTEQFFNEARLLSGLHHKNLVTLYGCTNPEEDDRLFFVYEFVPNDTVADHLYGKRVSSEILSWPRRMQILIETAEALTYLHTIQPPIIHRDVKTNNILLDNNFNVKLADFGLCLLLPSDATHVTTMPRGTQGYLDPEYNQCYKLTTKSDVYSFGVVLLELISGLKALDEKRDTDDVWLVRMAFNKIKNKKPELLVDPELKHGSDLETLKMVTSVTELAYKCLRHKSSMRPPMVEVLRTLKKIRNGKQLAVDPLDHSHFSYLSDSPVEQNIVPVQNPRDISKIPFLFTYKELEVATNSFAYMLGGGRYSTIYLGVLRDRRMVAVKVLDAGHHTRYEQFYKEVRMYSVLDHPNLVELYGFTDPELQKLLLVYELVPNSNVSDHLRRGRLAEGALTWTQRIQIAIQTAEALAYLHSSHPPIIHRDVKTDNILLDYNFNAKVANLGLSRIIPWDASHVTTAPQGTDGYMDPEYSMKLKLSDKSDVYSFGVVLLELISGKSVMIDEYTNVIHINYLELEDIENNEIGQLVDPELGYHSDQEIKRMITSAAELAFRSLKALGSMRPPMGEVLTVLKEIKGA